jgi:hypothetical protein
MKTKLLSVLVAATAAFSGTSGAVTLALSGISNGTVGLITLDTDGAGPELRTTVSGRAIFVSTTSELTGVSASMATLLGSANSTPAMFDTALATLIGVTDPATSPGIVRSATFSAGAMTSTGNVQLGNVANKTYLFLVAESGGFITGIGAYTGSNVPAAGSVTFNPAFANDGLGVGTSVLAAATASPVQPISGFQLAPAVAIPEPSTMLLGALGALGLLRRRR